MNICLKADVIILHSDQVDEYLSQKNLALPSREWNSGYSQAQYLKDRYHNFTKI